MSAPFTDCLALRQDFLRQYQCDAVARARDAIRAGKRRVLLVAPTGAGKTRIGTAIAARHLSGRPDARVLWLTHRSELMMQAVRALETGGLAPAPYAASLGAGDLEAGRILVASVQTLLARGERPSRTLLILDEAHHFAADEWAPLASELGDGVTTVGLTATPARADGRGLGALFDALVPVSSIAELQALGHLAPCEVARPPHALLARQIAECPVEAYLREAPGERAIAFFPRIEDAKDACASFEARGVSARFVTSETPVEERARILEEHRAGRFQVLCNVAVLTEGYDDPEVSVCILARRLTHHALYLQIVGRILRAHPKKSRALFLDLVGASHLFGLPDAPRDYSLSGIAIRPKSLGARYCQVCGALLESDARCTACALEESELGPLKNVRVGISKFHALREGDGEEKRVERLVKWLTEARALGRKPGSALYKYKAVYGEWPTSNVNREAFARANSRSCTPFVRPSREPAASRSGATIPASTSSEESDTGSVSGAQTSLVFLGQEGAFSRLK